MGEIKETKDKAIRAANDHEIREHREPKDVLEKRGYDIISISPDGQERHIEIKGRRKEKAPHVFLTENELKMAKEDPNFWLYLTVGEGSNIKLYTIPGRIVAEKVKREIRWRLGLRKWIKEFQQEV